MSAPIHLMKLFTGWGLAFCLYILFDFCVEGWEEGKTRKLWNKFLKRSKK